MMPVKSYDARLTGLVHIATPVMLGDGTTLYVWCQGEDIALAWERQLPCVTPTCLACIAAGPKGEWKNGRMEMVIEGEPYIVIDSEPNGR